VLPYDPRLKALAKELRKQSTLAEILLWNHLKRRQRFGYDFHRQKPILHWIADFFCEDLMLAIEIDGDSHRFRADNDARKEAGLKRLGIVLLRFGDTQVKQNALSVVATIDAWIAANRATTSSPRKHLSSALRPVPSPQGES
jgi:very-short-patch-repair endonuclease